jgi:hypothetical protein
MTVADDIERRVEARAAFKAALVELYREHSPVEEHVNLNRRAFVRSVKSGLWGVPYARWRTGVQFDNGRSPENTARAIQVPYETLMAIHALCFHD